MLCLKANYSLFNNILKKSSIQNCTYMYNISHFFNDYNLNTTHDLSHIATFLENSYFIFDVLKSIIEHISMNFFYHCKRFNHDRIKTPRYIDHENSAVPVVNIAI
jgi:hypothetical protein